MGSCLGIVERIDAALYSDRSDDGSRERATTAAMNHDDDAWGSWRAVVAGGDGGVLGAGCVVVDGESRGRSSGRRKLGVAGGCWSRQRRRGDAWGSRRGSNWRPETGDGAGVVAGTGDGVIDWWWRSGDVEAWSDPAWRTMGGGGSRLVAWGSLATSRSGRRCGESGSVVSSGAATGAAVGGVDEVEVGIGDPVRWVGFEEKQGRRRSRTRERKREKIGFY